MLNLAHPLENLAVIGIDIINCVMTKLHDAPYTKNSFTAVLPPAQTLGVEPSWMHVLLSLS